MERPSPPIALLLPDIRSEYNVGSIFRTADGAGVDRIYCSGYTPLPIDRFGRPSKTISKTALGAEKVVPWEHAPNALALVGELRREGWAVVALEEDARAKLYTEYRPDCPTLLILGNEIEGVPEALRDASDAILAIPMRGEKESLNVSVVCGIALYHLTRSW
jgi:tRNA G18 (ribose-2'-O)-methylase SpoU